MLRLDGFIVLALVIGMTAARADVARAGPAQELEKLNVCYSSIAATSPGCRMKPASSRNTASM
jgi:hypothetical protein